MEKPNLEYIEQLARGDESIRNELIEVIKTEFPEEKEEKILLPCTIVKKMEVKQKQ
ncbi:hypothetical protein [Polaribacter atrinae]|uniref:hypothetical protein n=1 Tax=Polaribacter atrinae TaxID=1333662 RepID=UPI000A443344